MPLGPEEEEPPVIIEGLDLEASKAVSGGSLLASAKTQIVPNASKARSGGELTVFSSLPLVASGAVSGAGTLPALTGSKVPLEASTAESSAELALSARTFLAPHGGAVSGASLLVKTGGTEIPFAPSNAVSGAGTLFLNENLDLHPANAVSGAAESSGPLYPEEELFPEEELEPGAPVFLTARSLLSLAAAATSGATAAFTAEVALEPSAAAATSGAKLSLTSGKTLIALNTVEAVSSATEELPVHTDAEILLGTAAATTTSSYLGLSAETTVGLEPSGAVSSTSLEVSSPTVPMLVLVSAAVSGGSLAATAETQVGLKASVAVSGAAPLPEVRVISVPLNPAVCTSTASLSLFAHNLLTFAAVVNPGESAGLVQPGSGEYAGELEPGEELEPAKELYPGGVLVGSGPGTVR